MVKSKIGPVAEIETDRTGARQMVIPNFKEFDKNELGKVWFVDVITEYGVGHFVPVHMTVEQCAEILNANYIAVVDKDCPVSIGTEKWLRVLRNPTGLHLHQFGQLAKERRFTELS